MFHRLAESGVAPSGASRGSRSRVGPLDLVDEARRAFADVAGDVSGALVYLDDGAAEIAHHACGAGFLLRLGAVNVLSLASARAADPDARAPVDATGATPPAGTPVVVLTARLLPVAAADVLACVAANPTASRVLVLCAASEAAHVACARALAAARRDRRPTDDAPAASASDAYADAVRRVRRAAGAILTATDAVDADTVPADADAVPADEPVPGDGWGDGHASDDGWGDWGDDDASEASASSAPVAAVGIRTGDDHGPGSSRVEVRHFPVAFAPVTKGAFVTPARGAAASAPVSRPERAAAGIRTGDRGFSLASLAPPRENGGEEDGSDAPVPPGVSVLAHTLADVVAALDARAECFAFGKTARATARAFAAAAAPAGARPCALVLVDRVADLLTPAAPHDGFLTAVVAESERWRGEDEDGVHEDGDGGKRCRDVNEDADEDGDEDGDFSASTSVPVRSLSPSIFRARGDCSVGVGGGGGGGDGGGSANAASFPPFPPFSFSSFSSSSSGFLSQPHDPRACDWVSSACSKSASEAATSARRWLLDATRDENLPAPPRPARGVAVTSEELRALAAPFAADPRLALRHHTMLSAANMTAVAIDPRATTRRRRRERALERVIRDAFSAAATRAGDGISAAAAADALVRALRETHGEGSSGAGRAAEAAALTLAAFVVAGEAASREGAAGGSEDDDDENGFGAAGVEASPVAKSDEALVRDALVEACVAAPGDGAPDPRQYEWLGDVGERLVTYWSSRTRAGRADDHRGRPSGPSGRPTTNEETVEADRDDDPDDGWDVGDDGWGDWSRDDDDGGDNGRVRGGSPPSPLAADGGGDRGRVRGGSPPSPLDPPDHEMAALRLEARDHVASFLERCGYLAGARRGAKCAGSLLGDGGGRPAGLLRELAGRVAAGADGEGAGADLFHAVASLGGLLKTGVGGALGRLGFKTAAAPRPSDAALVVVFVIGGVSPGEIADVRAAAAGLGVVGGETKVEDILVGGTGLLGEFDVLRLVAARDA